jgi:hypothetical protein
MLTARLGGGVAGKVGRSLAGLIAWYIIDSVMNGVSFLIAMLQLGRLTDIAGLTPSMLVGDRFGWSHLLPPWISLILPSVAIAALLLLRIELRPAVALKIGLGIVSLQLILAVATHADQLLMPWFGVFCIERFLIVLPGPLAASVASRNDFLTDGEEA